VGVGHPELWAGSGAFGPELLGHQTWTARTRTTTTAGFCHRGLTSRTSRVPNLSFWIWNSVQDLYAENDPVWVEISSGGTTYRQLTNENVRV